MGDVVISFAAPSDVDEIHRLEHASFPSPWRRAFFDSELIADGRFNLVAKRDRKLVGYLFAMWFFDEMHVNKIAVDETERRQGIARSLMDRCISFATEHGVNSISLEVRKSNEGAIEFYRSLDFEVTYVRAKYYPDGEAALVMTKKM
jgi:ribosomal-protein-alanine N-acetyltransferase